MSVYLPLRDKKTNAFLFFCLEFAPLISFTMIIGIDNHSCVPCSSKVCAMMLVLDARCMTNVSLSIENTLHGHDQIAHGTFRTTRSWGGVVVADGPYYR